MAQNYWYKKYCINTSVRHSHFPHKRWWEAYWNNDKGEVNLIGYSKISLADVRKQAKEWVDNNEQQ